MSGPKFFVFKLKDLRIPALVLLIVIVLFVFMIFRNKATQTFAPSTGYEDGQYIAGITVSDTNMDLVVEVKDNNIASISLEGLTKDATPLYDDLNSGLNYINTYVTATQSLELPQNGSTTPATMLLMDAVKVALSDGTQSAINTSYEKVDLSSQDSVETLSDGVLNEDDIFVDEFSEDDFPAVGE